MSQLALDLGAGANRPDWWTLALREAFEDRHHLVYRTPDGQRFVRGEIRAMVRLVRDLRRASGQVVGRRAGSPVTEAA